MARRTRLLVYGLFPDLCLRHGLEGTFSQGIVSSVRKIDGLGTFLQIMSVAWCLRGQDGEVLDTAAILYEEIAPADSPRAWTARLIAACSG
jgi:hypothetical protein